MVGFFCETPKEDADSAVNQLKSRTPTCPERYSVDREAHLTESDGLSLASLEPFVDFDLIKDWIEEMQVPDSSECKAEVGNGLGEDPCLVNLINDISAPGMDDKETSTSVKDECYGTDGLLVEDKGGLVGIMKSNVPEESSLSGLVKNDLGNDETKSSCHQGEIMSPDKCEDGSGVDILDSMSCNKLGSLSCSIEEGLEKVSLVGGKDDLVIDVNDMKAMDTKVTNDDVELNSESETESESETSSSSSSLSSSSSGSDNEAKDMVKDEELCEATRDSDGQKVDVEEGEIMDSDVEKMVSWTENDVIDVDNDDDNDDNEEDEDDTATEICDELDLGDDIDDGDSDLPKGAIRSKNELQDLPPVPPVTISLQPSHDILPVGVVSSVLGTQVVVEGSEKHNPISEGSILWITEKRLPLGIIDEIFGPVKTPYYIVRYNSESDVPSDIQNGSAIGFVSEFAGHVLNDKNLYQKGYDASGENDEEICDEAEFSDDEKEAEYRRMLKMSKRENNNDSQGPGNKKKNRRTKGRENTWTKNQPSDSQSPILPPSQPNKMQQHLRPLSPRFSQGNQSHTNHPVFTGGPSAQSLGKSNQSCLSPMGPNFSGGPSMFPQMSQPGPVQLNGNWTNRMPPQPQNMAMPNGFQPNGLPWLQQNYPQPMQMPSNTPIPWQQQQQVPQFPLGTMGPSQPQFDLSQLLAGFNGPPPGPMNFNTSSPNLPWPGMMGQNLPGQAPFIAGFQNPNVQLPVFQGFMPNGPQPAGLNSSSVPAASFIGNSESSSQTHQGSSSGRGRGRKSFQYRGGRSGVRRGR